MKAYLLFKLQKGPADVLHVMSTGKADQGIIIGTWDQFKEYKQGSFTDVIFRHLFCDRDQAFFTQT